MVYTHIVLVLCVHVHVDGGTHVLMYGLQGILVAAIVNAIIVVCVYMMDKAYMTSSQASQYKAA